MTKIKGDANNISPKKNDEKKKQILKKLSLTAQNMYKNNTANLEHLIKSSYQYCVKRSDSDQFRQYIPKMLWNNPCQYFPSTPLENFQSPQLFEKFNLDTLFFIFYYQPGTYQQHLAAKELKKKCWKYHKKYTTWFQPQENVRNINNQIEHGTFLSFDYETTWSKQLRNNFAFENIYLEDEIIV